MNEGEGMDVSVDPLMASIEVKGEEGEKDEEELHGEWVTHFCVVQFDLELGQTVEYVYPSGPSNAFSEEERSNIAFLSFPDSNCVHSDSADTIFSFRIRKTSSASDRPFSYRYGYVYFRQQKDENITRGYLQKSVVLMTEKGFGFGLYKKMVSIVGPLYFQHGSELLEAAFRNILAWSPPSPGGTYELPLLGTVLSFHIPYSSSPHIIDAATHLAPSISSNRSSNRRNATEKLQLVSSRDCVVSNLQAINIYSCFRGLTTRLWLLWELVLTNQPVLVISPSPSQCSEAVLGLVSLIAPLEYCGDFRPYFTIHDSEFKEYTSAGSPRGAGGQGSVKGKRASSSSQLPPVILGVTNPFFIKTLTHWPHVVHVGKPQMKRFPTMLHKESSYTPPTSHLQKRKLMSGGGGEKGSSMGGLIWTSAGETPPRIGGGKRSRVVSVDRESKEYTQTVQTKLTASVELDKEVVRKLMMEEGRETSLVVAQNNEVLRRYFLRMTESFLIPLERYFSSLMPLVKTISPFFPPPRLKEFNEEEFLEGFLGKERVASKEFVIKRDKERELYRAFIRSPNFRGWFRSRKMEAVGRLRAIYLDTVLEADLPSMLKGRSDVEMVDMYLRLLTVLKKKYVPDTLRPQLQEQLHSIVSLLPEDLRDSVAQNFERHKPDEKGVSVG